MGLETILKNTHCEKIEHFKQEKSLEEFEKIERIKNEETTKILKKLVFVWYLPETLWDELFPFTFKFKFLKFCSSFVTYFENLYYLLHFNGSDNDRIDEVFLWVKNA